MGSFREARSGDVREAQRLSMSSVGPHELSVNAWMGNRLKNLTADKVERIPDDERPLKVTDVARLLGVSQGYVRDHISRSRPIIPHMRFGRAVRFELDEIAAYKRQHTHAERLSPAHPLK